jgi:N-acetylglucosaminyldiphosphoundecaprenol N-acetyl-beta-D-mannosaminyltransferase
MGALSIQKPIALASGERLAANDSLPEVVVGGLRIARLSRSELAEKMVEDCLAARRQPGRIARTVFAANGHAIALAALDSEFRRRFEDADIVHADGQALVFASKLITSTPVSERSATTDFIHDAARAAATHGLKFFLLGATEEVNRRCAEQLLKIYPGLKIASRRHGYFARDEEDAICQTINESGADIVWIGLGVPLEYEFASRNQHRFNAGWLVTCGGCFNYISGDYRRAPGWMQRAGLEWLHRLVDDPKRLFWRYAVTNPLALLMLLIRTSESRPAPAVKPVGQENDHAPIPAPARLRRA